MNSNRVAIIGGGLGGLATACTLAARGHSVVLLERNAWLGGKATVLQEGGYRFDMGPTILTLPSVLRRIFEEAGRNIDEYLDLIELDPQWRCFFEDGSRLDLVKDSQVMAESVAEFSQDRQVGEGYTRFMQVSERLNDVSQRYFFWRSVGGIRDALSGRNPLSPSVVSDLIQLRPGRTVAGLVRAKISDERVAQMIDHFTQYVGSAPQASPAVLCGIAHMQTSEGIWYPRGGIGRVTDALVRLASELGVEIRTGVSVERIEQDGKRVRGVELESGERVPADVVVSNSDTVRTHRELVNGRIQKRFDRRRRYEPACSGVVLYLGLKRRYDHLLHHNFAFSDDPHDEFDWIYRRGEPAPDPTCYVCAPATSDPTVAPDGCEALYVLVHTPFLRAHHDWEKMLQDYRGVILKKLERTAGLADLEANIEFESTLTPQDIDRRYNVWKGAIYGLASHGRFNGAFKPANRSPDLAGLYFAGGSAHPGPGMPMVLMSGWIAADTVHNDLATADQ